MPGDKSISHRSHPACPGSPSGTSEVSGFLASEDCLASLAAMRALGVPIEQPAPTQVRVHGVGLRGLRAAPHALDMGNAGTAIRLFTGLLAAQTFDSRLIGDESLMRRPMERVARPLREMGAEVRTRDGTPPVDIERRAAGCTASTIAMPVASAQVKSAILLAALYAEGATRVASPAVCRDHSERMLLSRRREDRERGARHHARSAAAAREPASRGAGRLLLRRIFHRRRTLGGAGEGLVLQNVGLNPTRTGLLDILRSMGGRIEIENARMSGAEPVGGSAGASLGACGASRCPHPLVPLAIDEFPVLFIAAACADGETVVTGAEELRVKESDRIAAMGAGFAALGVEHSVTPDGMRIRGPRRGSGIRRRRGRQPRRSSDCHGVLQSRACGRPSPSRCAIRRMWPPPFRVSSSSRASAGLDLDESAGVSRDGERARPHHRRSLRVRQGHGQPRRRPGLGLGAAR